MHLCLLSLRNLLTWVNGRRLCGKNRRLENAIFFNKRHCLRSPLAFWQRCCRLFYDAAWTVFQFKPIFALKESCRTIHVVVFLTAILHRGLRNDFFFQFQFTFSNFYLDFYFPFSIWTFVFLFSLVFYFPFYFPFPLFLWTFIFPFLFGLLFNQVTFRISSNFFFNFHFFSQKNRSYQSQCHHGYDVGIGWLYSRSY